MLLTVVRYEESLDHEATIGRLLIAGTFECFTLEDRVREIVGQPVASWKVAGRTAIPTGTYEVVIDHSPLFSARATKKAGRPVEVWTPHLLEVPAYQGVRIHGGNRSTDTEGCILPGSEHPARVDYVGGSRLALDRFLPKLEEALGLARVEGSPETWSAGTLPQTVWHYEEKYVPDGVRLKITNDFFVPVDPGLTAE